MPHLNIYQYEDKDIKISMDLYFNEQDQLIFDGYDIGRKVLEIRGRSDYEYKYTIAPGGVQKLAELFQIEYSDRTALLQAIKDKFGGNEAYSKFGAFMDSHGVKYEVFMWG
jgi:hypothetical protein